MADIVQLLSSLRDANVPELPTPDPTTLSGVPDEQAAQIGHIVSTPKGAQQFVEGFLQAAMNQRMPQPAVVTNPSQPLPYGISSKQGQAAAAQHAQNAAITNEANARNASLAQRKSESTQQTDLQQKELAQKEKLATADTQIRQQTMKLNLQELSLKQKQLEHAWKTNNVDDATKLLAELQLSTEKIQAQLAEGTADRKSREKISAADNAAAMARTVKSGENALEVAKIGAESRGNALDSASEKQRINDINRTTSDFYTEMSDLDKTLLDADTVKQKLDMLDAALVAHGATEKERVARLNTLFGIISTPEIYKELLEKQKSGSKK